MDDATRGVASSNQVINLCSVSSDEYRRDETRTNKGRAARRRQGGDGRDDKGWVSFSRQTSRAKIPSRANSIQSN